MLQAQTHLRAGLPTGRAPQTSRALGRYTLLEPLAVGGMAELQLGRSPDGRVVVVKEVAAALRQVPRYSELLTAEALLTERFSHPNIVRAVGFGRRREDGQPYLALEWVQGLDLRALLRVCTQRRIALPIAHSLGIMASVLRALDEVHRARDERGVLLDVVHGDVSPANVLLGFDGRVKLCDFGIARATVMPPPPADVVEGKAGYMSPEHATSDLDARADIYACGVMLWELLSGRRLRKPGTTRSETPMLPVRGLPKESMLHAIVHRALARDRAERHPSAAAMLREIEHYQAASGLKSSELELAAWLAEQLPDLVEEAEQRRQRMLSAPDAAGDPPRLEAPEIGLEESGARRVRRTPAPAPAMRDQLLLVAARSCAITLLVLGALVALGVL